MAISAGSGSREMMRWNASRNCASRSPSVRERLRRHAARRFHVGLVVQQHERLQRRIGARRGGRRTSRAWAHRRRAARAAGSAVSKTCRGCGARGLRRGPPGRSARHRRRPLPIGPAAGTASRSGRRFLDEQAARRERLVADHLGGKAETRAAREQAILRVPRQERRCGHGRLPVGGAEHDPPQRGLHIPADPVESVPRANRAAPDAWAVRLASRSHSGVRTSPSPKHCCHSRFTAPARSAGSPEP